MKPKDTRNLNPNTKDLNWKSLGVFYMHRSSLTRTRVCRTLPRHTSGVHRTNAIVFTYSLSGGRSGHWNSLLCALEKSLEKRMQAIQRGCIEEIWCLLIRRVEFQRLVFLCMYYIYFILSSIWDHLEDMTDTYSYLDPREKFGIFEWLEYFNFRLRNILVLRE